MSTRKATMPKGTRAATPTRVRGKPDDPEQAKRFVEMAREIGAAETEEEADRALKRVLRPKTRAS